MKGVSILAELQRMGRILSPQGEEWVRMLCPFHEDAQPSCDVNVKSGGYKCHSCGAKGSFVKLMARITGHDMRTCMAYLEKAYDLEAVKIIEPSVIEKMHQDLWAQKHLLRELYDRGVTDEDIRLHRIGYGRERVAIPIKNDNGQFVNVRYYLPGAPSGEKFKNERGRGKMRLCPPDQLKYPRVLITGGELKAFVGARVLNPHDIGCICASGGESNWDPSFTIRFKGKERIWIGLDTDDTGRKAAQVRAAQVSPLVPWVGIVEFPLDADKYPHGDLNDFVGREGGDLLALLEGTRQWVPATRVVNPDEEPARMEFSQTIESRNVGKRIKFAGVVAAVAERTFVVPRRVVVTCSKDQDCCASCAVLPIDDKVFHVSPESPAILKMMYTTDEHMDLAVRAALGVPKKCKVVEFAVTDHFNVEDVRLNPSLEITNRNTERTLQQAACVGCDATLNGTYDLVGRMYPHPKSQHATLVISKSDATHDALARHVPKDLHRMRIFRPLEWTLEGLTERLDEIYADLETNVTHIFKRRDMHLFFDLIYHSVLLMRVDEKVVKGWTDLLIIGDSGQGKSEICKTIMEHYRLGEKIDCKNASPAGLLGGLAEIAGQWMVQWGIVPTNDGRVVFFEEAKGMSTEMIGSMTDMRSSGQAEITKISKRRTHARTRLGWLSNARFGRNMASYNYGVEAVRDLMGAPEDVRRLDAALIVASGEVDQREINALVHEPPVVKHRYGSEACNALILWAWTRKDTDVRIAPDALEIASREASLLCDEFSDAIPLVDKGTMRYKLCRLATALACRTFSCGDEETQVLTRSCHMQYVVDLLRRLYSSDTFGYLTFSAKEKLSSTLMDPDQILERLEMMPNPHEAREHLLTSDLMDAVDLCDWFGWDRQEAQGLMSLLVRKNAIKRLGGNKYAKSPEFIVWLKNVELKPRPEYLKNEKF